MRGPCLAVLVLALIGFCSPVSGAVSLTISSSAPNPHIGDVVTLNGTISGITTVAVYLFVTGPGLDPRGTPLDNLNVPTGRGLFTTAPVHMENGSWFYTWDTAVILGKLHPGNYTIHAVYHPIDGLHFAEGEHAMTTVSFQPPRKPVAESPSSPFLPIAATGIAALVSCLVVLVRR